MHKKSKMLRSLSMVLTAAMLATTLPEVGIRVDAAESVAMESMDVVNPVENENDGDVSTRDVSAENTSVKLTVADMAYVNKAGKYVSAPVLMDSNGKKLAAGTDYEKAVVYTWNGKILDPKKDIVPVGSEVTVTVTGRGCYTGSMSATYRITEKSFASAKITVNKQTYTGKPIQLTAEDVKVVMGKDTLVYGVDFEVAEDSYVNNVAKGNASVTIKGKGKYGGMKTVKFTIVPKGIN